MTLNPGTEKAVLVLEAWYERYRLCTPVFDPASPEKTLEAERALEEALRDLGCDDATRKLIETECAPLTLLAMNRLRVRGVEVPELVKPFTPAVLLPFFDHKMRDSRDV